MVDRITSHRDGAPEVPRAEPLPAKALVVEDLGGVLPAQLAAVPGVITRTSAGALGLDIQLKLRIANGLHTAMVYAMALGGRFTTDLCAEEGGHVLLYLERLFERDIVWMTSELGCARALVTPVFTEWLGRLTHPHFGLSCFFVSQNAMAKLRIRLLPSIHAAINAGEAPSPFMAFGVAALLRFLTPFGAQDRLGEARPVFLGRLDAPSAPGPDGTDVPAFTYAAKPELGVVPARGTYEFVDEDGLVPLLLRPLGRFAELGCAGPHPR
jgi:hypothetical protein